VSIFIIAGLILLIGAGIYFFFASRTAVFNPEDITEIHSVPITSYVSECVKRESYDAIQKLGKQGGYLFYPPNIEYDPRAYIEEIPRVSPKVPFWYYQGSARIPTIEKMEEDLSKYVKDEAYGCIDEFNTFRDEYVVDILENITIAVHITEKNIQFDTYYPVDIIKKSNNQKIELRDYKTTVQVRLKESYEMAKRFVESDIENGYLENLTIHMIMLLGGEGVPLDGLEFGVVPKKWSVREVKDTVYDYMRLVLSAKVRFNFNDRMRPFSEDEKTYQDLEKMDEGEILTHYLVENDYYDEQVRSTNIGTVPKDMYDYKHFYFPIFDSNEFKGLESNAYIGPEKNFLLIANPNKNGYLYSYKQSLSESASFPITMVMQFWHFLYDVYYPVIFAVNDATALDNRGFVFKIAYPVFVKGNRPAQRRYVAFDNFEYYSTKDLCDQSEKVDRTAMVFTRDAHSPNVFTGEPNPVKNVEVFYECPTGSCYYGNSTFIKGMNNVLGISMNIPKACPNGILVARKEGYITKKVQALRDQNEFNIDMVPLKKFNFTVEAFSDYGASDDDNDGTIDLVPYDLSRYNKNHTIMVSVESYNYSYSAQSMYVKNTSRSKMNSIYDYLTPNEISLAGGKYKLDIYLILDDETVVGGYHGNLTVTYATLDDYSGEYDFDKSNIKFKVYTKVPMPRKDNDEDLMAVQSVFDDNKFDNINQLKPVFE
jgi:hypothetical protein